MGLSLPLILPLNFPGLIAAKTKLDILLAPLAGILGGSLVGIWVGPPSAVLMNQLGAMINWGNRTAAFPYGDRGFRTHGHDPDPAYQFCCFRCYPEPLGAAAGAATIGCCCNMVGFAVASYKENGISGLLAQGIGTSMLQVPNIMRHPLIWLPAIISSAVLGPRRNHACRHDQQCYRFRNGHSWFCRADHDLADYDCLGGSCDGACENPSPSLHPAGYIISGDRRQYAQAGTDKGRSHEAGYVKFSSFKRDRTALIHQ